MKRKTLALLLITAVSAFSACDLFTPKQTIAQNPLLGKWKIDSIATTQDSTAFGYLLLAMSINDSADYDYQFDKDTMFFFGKDALVVKAPYLYNDSSRQLVIEDSTSETYVVRPLNDSITGLHSADSSIIFLKRR
jgi:hypothetical protein